MLHTLPAGFVRCVHIDGGHQFPQSVAVQLIDAHILVRRLNELLNVFVLSFLYFNFLSQSYALGLQLLLLRFIGQAQHIEALITQPSAGVVLVNPDEQPFQFSDAVFVPFQPFPSDADLLTAFQPELFLHHCTEMCLMPQNVARHSLNVFQDYVAEYGFPDVMSTALVLVLLMERTVKERALRSVIVRRPLIQLLTAVGTVHQPGKDAASACTGLAMPLLAHLLCLIAKHYTGTPCRPKTVAVAALYHDAPEIITGDMPTPVKYHSLELRGAYKDVEKMANDRLLAMLPEDLRKCFAPYLCEGRDYDHQIVKAADSLSAYLKCVEERRAGNHEFDAAGEAIRRQLDAITLPEVQDFIREFVPSFSLTLDELNQPGGHQA